MSGEATLALTVNQYLLFGGASAISLAAFIGLILVPALGSVGRPWEKVLASFLSLFVLVTLVLIGIAIGLAIFLNWGEIEDLFGQG